MKTSPRVVLDTNVVLSALVFAQGSLAPLRQAWQRAACHPLVSKATTEELMRVLAYPKFRLGEQDRRELLADYLPYCTTVRVPSMLPPMPTCRDVCDLPFLELAAAGKADSLVTGDRDLLALSGSAACPIVTADEFMASLKD
ncbi:MAG: putative toxin-antitoxin system toxin component, PIN family [Rhodocyclaceae bacterium]|nr:putative toxin-antitoxin system toxin component, PIN family [Rhodocyclaceae bacterium]